MIRSSAIVCCLALVACDPVQMHGITLTPQPALSDSVRLVAFAVAHRVATRHGLSTVAPAALHEERWHECLGAYEPAFSMCSKATTRSVQFLVFEGMKFRLSPLADTVKRELADSLRAKFGAAQVRECRWSTDPDPEREGCPP